MRENGESERQRGLFKTKKDHAEFRLKTGGSGWRIEKNNGTASLFLNYSD